MALPVPIRLSIDRKGPTVCCSVYVHEIVVHVVHVGCDVHVRCVSGFYLFATSAYHGITLRVPIAIGRKGSTVCCGVYVHEN